MPTKCTKDTDGCFCQWGSQKKYYYECSNEDAAKQAKSKADLQGRTIRSRGYKIINDFLNRFS